jgi:beta-galactosidase
MKAAVYKLGQAGTPEHRELIDAKTVKTGIRTVRVSREHGFELNGQTRKLKGVCLHHDLGPLGAAVNKAALIRQVHILKQMGCDAIRTSHNMPSTMQMEVYDSLGMMVMAESFDMWIYPKCKNGYARFFRQWAEKDVENLVLNHRNHPSLVMWSIGNEIPEQWSEEGRQISIRLQGICHVLDPSRPVTQGMDRVDNALSSGFAQAMDVPGFNYRVHKYLPGIERLPQGFLLGSETASTVSSRGVYKFPVEYSNHKTYDDGQCNGYDSEWCSWSNLPEIDFMAMDDLPFTIGQFVWTGFDYLGEPTPYDGYWPSRSSYFGICDLAGLPKDRYYLYRSQWNTGEHTIHLLPHWTWSGREGEVTPVYCYSDYPTAELFVNGKSQGKITKASSEQVNFYNANVEKHTPQTIFDRYRLRWNNVRYEPGELKVVVYDEQNNRVGEQVVRTAGKPTAMKLDVWTQQGNTLKADGDDLAYVTVSLVDKRGVEVPVADDQLVFEVKGAGSFRAVCNGDATSTEVFTEPTMRLFNGKLVVTVQAADHAGKLQLTVRDKSNSRVKASTVSIDVR